MKAGKVTLGNTTSPSVTSALACKRLFGLLDRDIPVAWVTGPPGCGKTTLAASWLDHAAIPYLWYQLDEGDGDVATFFYYLSLAAASLEGEHERLPLLTPEYQPALSVHAALFRAPVRAAQGAVRRRVRRLPRDSGVLAAPRRDARRARDAAAGRARARHQPRRPAGRARAAARQPGALGDRLGGAAPHARGSGLDHRKTAPRIQRRGRRRAVCA